MRGLLRHAQGLRNLRPGPATLQCQSDNARFVLIRHLSKGDYRRKGCGNIARVREVPRQVHTSTIADGDLLVNIC